MRCYQRRIAEQRARLLVESLKLPLNLPDRQRRNKTGLDRTSAMPPQSSTTTGSRIRLLVGGA